MMNFVFGMQVNIKAYQIFLIELWKVGASWISRKEGILEKWGVDLEKGPPLQTMHSLLNKIFM